MVAYNGVLVSMEGSEHNEDIKGSRFLALADWCDHEGVGKR